jgi:hypothetical protein
VYVNVEITRSARCVGQQRLACGCRGDSVVVEAGSHDRSVRLKTVDLVRLTRAQVADVRREEPTAG